MSIDSGHTLRITSEGAMSHSGFDYTGRCSCGQWGRKYGDHSGFVPHTRLDREHREHVWEATREQNPADAD